MRGLKITLLLVLVAVFALCDTSVKQFRAYRYGQNPSLQSRGLDILSLRKSEESLAERTRSSSGRNIVYPEQSDASQSNQLSAEASSMRLRGNIAEEDAHVVLHPDSSDVERYRIHTHHWRPNMPIESYNDQPSRSRGVQNDDDVVNQAEEARLQAERAAEAERYRIHTHHWRPQDQQPQHLAESESRSRNVRDTDEDIINRGEDARLQEQLREKDSSRSRAVYEIQERSEEDKQREQREADAEQYRIHTHHWRPVAQPAEESNPEQSSRSRRVFSELTQDELVNSDEEARLRAQREAEAEKYRIHTHHWRPEQQNNQQRSVPNDVYQEGQVEHSYSANARSVDEENEVIARAEEARLQEQRAAEAERYRVHTHHWRPQDQPPQHIAEENNSASRSRNIRDTEDDVIARGEDARLQEQLREQGGNARSESEQINRVHTHVWRQVPYQEQEQREADVARAIRARNMNNVEPESNAEQSNVHTHVWRGSVPVNDLRPQQRNVVDDERDRINHGQHMPDTPFEEGRARSYQARDAGQESANVVQDYHVPRGMQMAQAEQQQAESSSNSININ